MKNGKFLNKEIDYGKLYMYSIHNFKLVLLKL